MYKTLEALKIKKEIRNRIKNENLANIKSSRQNANFKERLIREFQHIDNELNKKGVGKVKIEVAERDYNSFVKAVYSLHELNKYTIEQCSQTEFYISKKQIII